MFMSPPEVSALAQSLQPTVPLFQIIDGYQNLQSVVAVLETQEGFQLDQNLAREKQQEGPQDLPEQGERVRYLGFFLSRDLDRWKPLRLQLQFRSRYAYTPLMLMLRAFHLQGERRVRLSQGLVRHEYTTVNSAGMALFDFGLPGDWLKQPERVTGFLVYLIRPGGILQSPSEDTQTEPEAGIQRAAPGLNVYKKIDTRV